MFRAAVFEQLGETRLEGALTTDICGKKDSFAVRMDNEAVDTIKKARLHRKVATAIFFESNGGQTRDEATVPELRLDVAEPDLDIGNVETVLETLGTSCYYLTVEGNRYRFSMKANLNRLLADRRANIPAAKMEERINAEVQKVFSAGAKVDRVFFPSKSGQVPDRPVLTFAILPPDSSLEEGKKTLQKIESFTRESGTSARTFKSAIIWCVPEAAGGLQEEARKVLAWEAIEEEEDELKLDEVQKRQLAENLKKAHRDLRESVWRTYKNIALLGKDNTIRVVDLGLVHSSAADSLVTLILNRLRQDGDLEEGISPNYLTRNWPPAFKEWSTKSVRDAFFASPQFPRLLNGDVVRDTIAKGVTNGQLAYVGKGKKGYDPFLYAKSIAAAEVEISEQMFIVMKDVAEEYLKGEAKPAGGVPAPTAAPMTGAVPVAGAATDSARNPTAGQLEQDSPASVVKTIHSLVWIGEVPAQKWMNFYTKVLARFATGSDLKISMKVEVASADGISEQKVEETKVSLRELGLKDDVGAV